MSRMKTTFLDFEQPIAELESKIEELRFVQDDSVLDISEEISRLQKKSQELTKAVYAKLTPWQISQVARHPQRPYTLDYIKSIFTDFHELHGDRAYADDPMLQVWCDCVCSASCSDCGASSRFADSVEVGHQVC